MGEQLFGRGAVAKAPPEFGIDANQVKVITIPLTVAQNLQCFEIGGNVLWALAATSLGAQLDVRLNDQQRDPIPVQQGLFFSGIRYSRIYVSNVAQAGETITLLYCTQERDNIRIENPAMQYNLIDLTKATVLDTLADQVIVAAAAAAQILPALATRRAAFICSLAANTQVCRIGDGNTGAARGQELAIGATMVLSTAEAIFAYTAAGANQTLAITWTAD